MEDPEDILQFPCDFPLKVIGTFDPQEDFETFVMGIVRKHIPELDLAEVSSRFSSGGKYHSVTVNFVAQSRVQVDALYCELSSHKRILYLL